MRVMHRRRCGVRTVCGNNVAVQALVPDRLSNPLRGKDDEEQQGKPAKQIPSLGL